MTKQKIKNAAAVALGEIGGSKSSPAKTAAARRNAKKAGRPMKEYLALKQEYAKLRKLATDVVANAGGDGQQEYIAALGEFLKYPGYTEK